MTPKTGGSIVAVFGSNQGVFKMKTSIRSFNTKGKFYGIGAMKIGVGDISPTSAAAPA